MQFLFVKFAAFRIASVLAGPSRYRNRNRTGVNTCKFTFMQISNTYNSHRARSKSIIIRKLYSRLLSSKRNVGCILINLMSDRSQKITENANFSASDHFQKLSFSFTAFCFNCLLSLEAKKKPKKNRYTEALKWSMRSK